MGRARSLAILCLTFTLWASAAGAHPVYRRADWRYWIDVDGDCQDTRQEVLIRDSREPVQLDDEGCRVLSGRWISMYTGAVIDDPTGLDIDHVVALGEAHHAGGAAWPAQKKEQYANDLTPGHLVAVELSVNRAKGSRPPDQWLPEWGPGRCWYIRARATVKLRYNLRSTAAERATTTEVLGKC